MLRTTAYPPPIDGFVRYSGVVQVSAERQEPPFRARASVAGSQPPQGDVGRLSRAVYPAR